MIDIVKWEAASDQLVWKFPNAELSTLTQLIVNQSQSAILFKDGIAMDVFGAGRHTLSTNNIPILNKLVNLPFGGQSPFAAEVWFVNHAIPLDLKWGTPNPLQLEDPQYGLVVPVSAFGQMGVQIVDPGRFVKALVGTMPSFSTRTVLEYFKGVLVSQLKASIAGAIVRRQIPVLQIEMELVEISQDIQRDISPHYERFGIEVHLFRIMSIAIPQDDPGLLELKKAKSAAARRKIEGTSYAQERGFDAMEASASNPGMGGVAANLGASLAMGQAMGAMVGREVHGIGRTSGPHPELVQFMDAIVSDGVISQKEREILRRKATELGMDPDEAEILADAKLHKLLQNQPALAGGLAPVYSPAPPVGGPPPYGGFGAAPMHVYHVQVNGQQVGPIPFEQMKQAKLNGQLAPDTPVWRDGLAAWGPAISVPELAALFGSTDPSSFGGPPASA